ncbi:MAG: hypothetical protein EX271_04655 [Acidimicrobiales bacterium]|nr:MAG: hypothetical protein EX271_04655 [Acidimicrobiales bacterium]
MELTGNADLEMLEFGALPSGSVAAKFQLEQSATTALKISSNGRYRPNAQLMAPLDEILGQSIIYDVNLKPVSGGIDILHADISGDKLQTTLSGRYSDNINIDGEADISAPYSYQTVKLNDTAQISYTIMGTTQNPTLKIDAKSSQVQVGGNVLNNPHFRAEFDQIRDNLEGPLQLDASTKFGDLLATTNVTRNESGLGFKNLNVRLDQLLASGFLAIAPDNLATGKMIINLAEGQKQKEQLSISLTPQDGKQGLELSVDTRNVAYKNIGFDAIRIQASGTLDRLSGRFEVDGRHGDKVTSPKFALALPFQLNRSSFGDITARGTPAGQYGNVKITGSEPVVLSLDSGRPNLKAALDVSDGKIEVDYSGLVDHDTLKIIIGNLPVSTLRLPGSLGDTKGRISALVNLNTKAPHPSGTANFSLTDWRGFEVEKGQGLTTRLDLVLNESAINWQLDGQAINGFKINGNGNFPVVVGSQLNSLRPNMLNPISGQLAASGPAAAIFGLITPSDDELLGNLNANLTISGTTTEPRLIGQANGKDIGFEFPELGTRIRNANFDAAFSNDGLQINSLTASDSNSGRMSANGKFTFGEFGRPLGELNLQATNFKALDRRDVDAWLDGNLIFQNGVTDSLLSGNIDIRKAELRQFVTGTASVVEIEVEEINRPKEQAGLLLEKPVSRVALDVKVKAPRNIFIRSRGIDVEMAVDADVNGTLTDPEFVGTATIIRGGYKIAGKNLAFENGTIEFDGPLSQAKMNLKAETETQNLKAGVDISGTMENPKIDLSSTPERPEDEILSALLFGRSVSELSIIESAQLAGALAQFSGVGSGFDLLGGVRNAFGFNQLNIDYKPNGGTQVSGGRYLAKNVYLQLFSGAGLDQSGAIIDWEIRKNIALRSRIQADYNQSLSLKWKKDF